MGLSRAREVKSVAVPVLARGDAEGLIYKVALLEGELVEAQRAQDVAREREREREREFAACRTHQPRVCDG
jgi:hypothetical protein